MVANGQIHFQFETIARSCGGRCWCSGASRVQRKECRSYVFGPHFSETYFIEGFSFLLYHMGVLLNMITWGSFERGREGRWWVWGLELGLGYLLSSILNKIWGLWITTLEKPFTSFLSFFFLFLFLVVFS